MSQTERVNFRPKLIKNRYTYAEFVGYTHVVVVDEFGNTGKPCDKEHYFGFGITIVDDPVRFGKISIELRREHHTDEYKANDATVEEKIDVSKKIRGSGVRTFACYVHKGPNMPEGMMSPKKFARICGMLGCTLDEVLPKTGQIYVIVDWNNQYKSVKKVESICESRSDSLRKVSGSLHDSAGDSAYADMLQANDYVASAARIRLEGGLSMRSEIIGTSFKQFGRNIEFRNDDIT